MCIRDSPQTAEKAVGLVEYLPSGKILDPGVLCSRNAQYQRLVRVQQQGTAAQQSALLDGKIGHRGHLQTVLFETE